MLLFLSQPVPRCLRRRLRLRVRNLTIDHSRLLQQQQWLLHPLNLMIVMSTVMFLPGNRYTAIDAPSNDNIEAVDVNRPTVGPVDGPADGVAVGFQVH